MHIDFSISYKDIGLRVKMIRLRKEITQEELAGITGLSSPHISNVETGNTKVSLPSLIKIANALDSSIDAILFDNMTYTRHVVEDEVLKVVSDCDDKEIRVIADTARALKYSMRQSYSKGTV